MKKSFINIVFILIAGLLLNMAIQTDSYAQPDPGNAEDRAKLDAANNPCTDQGKLFDPKDADVQGVAGITGQVVKFVKDTVNDAAEKLFTGIINDAGYKNAVNAAITLFVSVFGVAFTFGLLGPLTLGQGSTRLIKIGVISTVMTAGWGFFNDNVVKFFNDGTDGLIAEMLKIAAAETNICGVGGAGDKLVQDAAGNLLPFATLDCVLNKAFSPKAWITIMGTIKHGPAGIPMAALTMGGTIYLIMMVISALKTYCISLIAKALLFGIAPIFIVFVLFEKTKHLFQGWVQLLVSFSLQPLLMFIFLSFFTVLIDSSLNNLVLKPQLCWVNPDGTVTAAGAGNLQWRFCCNEKCDAKATFQITWKGVVGGENCFGDKDFPIGVIDIASFLVLCYLGFHFMGVVSKMANDIAGTDIQIDKLTGG
jgi:type IV secretion system protein VirB6